MDSSEIIKRRLADLKKMSVELRQSTENESKVDLNLVFGILEATKSSSATASKNKAKANSSPLVLNQKSFISPESPLVKLLSMNSGNVTKGFESLFPENQSSSNQNGFPIQHEKHNTAEFIPNDGSPNRQQTFGLYSPSAINQKNSMASFANQNSASQLQYNQQLYEGEFDSSEQIIALREQNAQLERKLMSLSQEMEVYRERSRQNEEDIWKSGLPFFKLSENLHAFYTRLTISQNDYEKIDYVSYTADLTLDRLVIRKSNKNSEGFSPANSQKQLDISELVEVQYIESKAVVLQFGLKSTQKDDSHSNTGADIESLFIKFETEEDLHRWDLALYINFKIVQSLKKDKLFSFSEINRGRSKNRKHSSESKTRQRSDSSNRKYSKNSSEYPNDDDSDLMKRLIERRDLYLETKKMVSEKMIEKMNEKKGSTKKDAFQQLIADEHSQTYPVDLGSSSKNESKTQGKNLFDAFLQNQTNPNSKDINNNQNEQNEKTERSGTSQFKAADNNVLQSPNSPGVYPSLNDKEERSLSFNPGNFDLSLSKKMEEERLKQEEERRREQQKKQQNIERIKKKMTIEGYELTKYSKDGFNFHDKRVYVSQDFKSLCWEEDGGKDKKEIPFDSIIEVQYEKVGEGIRKFIKNPKKQEHCIISYRKKNEIKVIELGSNVITMSQFAEDLNTLKLHLMEKKQL